MKRRESLKIMAVASLAAAFPGCTMNEVDRAASRLANGSGTPEFDNRLPSVFSEHQFQTISALVDFIIPADERSGSATDAAVPTFIDFILEEVPDIQAPLFDGLSWLNTTCSDGYGSDFIGLPLESQTEMLDRIAFPDDFKPGDEDGVSFFTTLRDLTASGFWSSKMGVEDLGYTGNTPQASWEGCTADAMAHLDVSYESE